MAERVGIVKCEKKKCEREAVKTLKFTDFVREQVEVEPRAFLCEEHAKKVQELFAATDGAAAKRWLEAD